MALPTSGLIIELDARAVNTALYNQGIGTWFDQSGHGFDAVYDYASGSAAAVLRSNQTPNGSAALEFTNASMWFGGGSNSSQFDGSTSAEIFIYVSINSLSVDNSGLYQFGGNDNTYYTYIDGNVYDGSFTNTRYSFPAAPNITAGTWKVYNVSHNGTTRTVRINGTVVHTATVAFTPPSQAVKNVLRIGRSQGVPWQGRIAGFIAYNRSLTSTERTQVTDYLAAAFTTASSPQVAQIPAASFTLEMRGDEVIYPADPVLAIPPASLLLDVGGDEGVVSDIVAIPPARLTINMSASASTASLTLSAPSSGDVLRIARPTFTVALSAPDPTVVYTIEIQYDDNASFTSPVTLSSALTAADGGVSLAATTDVPATTYWRARLLLAGSEEVTWTLPASFTVSTAVTPATLAVQWTADANAARPIHVWHFDPAGPLDGDTVTIYGQGFPATGSLTFGDTVLPTTGWQLVAATADNADDTKRVIEGSAVTPEHYEVQFTAPVSDGPGGALVLEG